MSPRSGSCVTVSVVLSVMRPPSTAVWVDRSRTFVAIVLEAMRGSAIVPEPPEPERRR